MQIIRIWMKEDFDEIWPDIEYWVNKALKYVDGKCLIDDVIRDVSKGDKHLWVVYTKTDILGFVITEILQYPRETRLGFFLCGGTRFDEWFRLREEVYCWAKELGCTSCEFYGRKGWIRKLAPHFKLEHVCLKEVIK